MPKSEKAIREERVARYKKITAKVYRDRKRYKGPLTVRNTGKNAFAGVQVVNPKPKSKDRA